LETLPPAGKIADLIRDYQKIIVEQHRDPLEEKPELAAELSNVLLGPVRKDLAGAKHVVIVPDGDLHSLNLETLPSPADPSRYWIDDVESLVSPSLSVLATPRKQTSSKPPPPKNSLLLIGAPVSVVTEYAELPAARAEIEGIQRQFGGAGDVRMGTAATPRAFLDSMPGRFSMIHFAAHAETNSQSPLESAVILSKSGDSYKLYARDVEQKDLSADLVTISACRSAGARAYGGEGLVGLAWAFLHSGAHAVIAGLWDVSDTSSSQLMETLYGGLAAKAEPAAALRQAKRALLHSNGSFRKPFFWAPYQIFID
jgi:CHAT domain-containing protein